MILVHTVGIQSVQMLTGSQLGVLQKAGRIESGLVPLKGLHYATIAKLFSLLSCFNNLFYMKQTSWMYRALSSQSKGDLNSGPDFLFLG